MWSADPQTYDLHKKADKKGSSDARKNKPEEGLQAENDDSDDMPEVQETVPVVPGSTLLWRISSRPAHSTEMYNFTNFAITLNELEPGMDAVLAPTDCRLRPDIRAMENGDIDLASREKERLEEKQRAARKELAKGEGEWSTRWFQSGTNPYTGTQDWIYTGGYFDRKYTECPDIY